MVHCPANCVLPDFLGISDCILSSGWKRSHIYQKHDFLKFQHDSYKRGHSVPYTSRACYQFSCSFLLFQKTPAYAFQKRVVEVEIYPQTSMLPLPECQVLIPQWLVWVLVHQVQDLRLRLFIQGSLGWLVWKPPQKWEETWAHPHSCAAEGNTKMCH